MTESGLTEIRLAILVVALGLALVALAWGMTFWLVYK